MEIVDKVILEHTEWGTTGSEELKVCQALPLEEFLGAATTFS